ncbi:MAG: metal-dependent hydrolase [Gemmatimonadetes bacterium]|nr:metal-dependent hydrolase [Gemmatimonadota bacterium]MDQ3318454.1 metal-dependent hydrolase [Actinomycetota bacterium]
MRTYSHAALTWTAARLSDPSEANAAWGAAGATLPDLPTILGTVWLGSRRRRLGRSELREKVCARRSFSGPDAALHSALPVGVLLLTVLLTRGPRERNPYEPLLAFLMGWAGHVLADALTHAGDARPILWPISGWRLRSPVSYWDRSHQARTFSMVEHGTLLLLAAWTISRRIPAPLRRDPPIG